MQVRVEGNSIQTDSSLLLDGLRIQVTSLLSSSLALERGRERGVDIHSDYCKPDEMCRGSFLQIRWYYICSAKSLQQLLPASQSGLSCFRAPPSFLSVVESSK